MDYSYAGKTAIVTGSSAGIGAATAILLSKLGANVTITGRNEDNLNFIAEECIKANGGKKSMVNIVVGDITQESVQKSILDSTLAKFTQLDVLVNNAGAAAPGCNMTQGSVETYDQIMNLNVRSVIQITKLCTESLKATKGSIVNVSSVAGVVASPTFTYYSMSKSAIDKFTKCFALEMAPFKVRVNAVLPGAVATTFYRGFGVDKAVADKLYAASAQNHPLGRIGQADEVAVQIVHLAHGQQSGWMTGVLLSIDGGMAMTPGASRPNLD